MRPFLNPMLTIRSSKQVSRFELLNSSVKQPFRGESLLENQKINQAGLILDQKVEISELQPRINLLFNRLCKVGFSYIINNKWSIFVSIQSRAFNYVPKFRNKLLKQGNFWPFASRLLVGVIFCLISSFQLNLADNYYFQEKLEMFTYKQV